MDIRPTPWPFTAFPRIDQLNKFRMIIPIHCGVSLLASLHGSPLNGTRAA
jgi:hypothetical protein